MGPLGDLQGEPAIAHSVVAGHGAALANAQHLLQIAGKGNEGGAVLGCSDGKLGVVLGPVDVAQIAVGVLYGGDLLEPQQRWQTLLQGIVSRSMRPRPSGL